MATASEKGTLIRIFDTATGTPLQELRRGADRAEIYSIAFHNNSQWLAVSSDKGTVHVFSLANRASVEDKSGDDEKKNPRSNLSFMKGLLPKYFSSEWSFAQFRVPEVKTIVAFGGEKNSIIVVGADGTFYKAMFDPEKPGAECIQESYAKFTKGEE